MANSVEARAASSNGSGGELDSINVIQGLGPVYSTGDVTVGFTMVDGEPVLRMRSGENEDGSSFERGAYDATGYKAHEAFFYGFFQARPVGSAVDTVSHILDGFATTGSELKDVAGTLGEFATVADKVDKYNTFFALPFKALIAGMKIKGFVEASKEDKLEKGCEAAAEVLKVGATSVKAARIIGTEFGKVSKTTAKILGWVSYGLKIVANAFNILGTAKALSEDRFSIPQEKTAALMKIVQAIISIAFFVFLVMATIFSFGMAGVIAGAVLGGIFGIGLMVTGIYRAHVDRLKSEMATQALVNRESQMNDDAEGAVEDAVEGAEATAAAAAKAAAEELEIQSEAAQIARTTLEALSVNFTRQGEAARLREEDARLREEDDDTRMGAMMGVLDVEDWDAAMNEARRLADQAEDQHGGADGGGAQPAAGAAQPVAVAVADGGNNNNGAADADAQPQAGGGGAGGAAQPDAADGAAQSDADADDEADNE